LNVPDVPEQGGSPTEAAEAVLRKLRGVKAVRVETDDAGAIRLVHVLGGPDRSPKVIAVDVVSALAAELGVQLEPRQVRVAAQQRTEESAPPEQARLKFVGLSVSALRNAAEVKVQLEDEGLMYEGISNGPNATRNRLELVAEATLRALEIYLRASGLFLLDGVMLSRIGGHEVVVAVVSLAGREEEILAGSSLVRDDPRGAVVRAILDATNRTVSSLLGR